MLPYSYQFSPTKARPNTVSSVSTIIVTIIYLGSSAVFLQDIFTITMLINIYGGKPESENSGYLKTDFIKNTSFPLQHVPSSQGTHNFFVYSEP